MFDFDRATPETRLETLVRRTALRIADSFGSDPDVRAIVIALAQEWCRDAEKRFRKYYLAPQAIDAILDDIQAFIIERGRHRFACLCTPAGVAASMHGMGAAQGSYT